MAIIRSVDFSQVRILIVEPRAGPASVISSLLRGLGLLELVHVLDLASALALLKDRAFHVVLIGIEHGAIELAQEGLATRVIALSDSGTAALVERAIRAGVGGFCVRPLSTATVRRAIDAALLGPRAQRPSHGAAGEPTDLSSRAQAAASRRSENA